MGLNNPEYVSWIVCLFGWLDGDVDGRFWRREVLIKDFNPKWQNIVLSFIIGIWILCNPILIILTQSCLHAFFPHPTPSLILLRKCLLICSLLWAPIQAPFLRRETEVKTSLNPLQPGGYACVTKCMENLISDLKKL